ncbi:hypothetical protein ILUMI_17151 [Ignelater luminosus]|uniref:Uncharacterized protein n=1 Tax=Ignelater luminosus TaxID=2038154 RepID=A0A8K0G7U2_IGNLU|nr:hypothetical protein ILUMI_17151 [Ignelater luminosus]
MLKDKALSEDLRRVIMNLSQQGNSGCKIAKTLGLLCYTVRDIIKYHKETGLITDVELRILGCLVKKNRRASSTALTALSNESIQQNYSKYT